MANKQRGHLFVSYAQPDADSVGSFVGLLEKALKQRAVPVDVWMDRESLRPGEQWQQAIEKAVLNSVGMLVFVSPASMESAWVRKELQEAVSDAERLVVPVILQHVADFPEELKVRQWLDESEAHLTPEKLYQAVSELAHVIASWLEQRPRKSPLTPVEAHKFAAFAAKTARSATTPVTEGPELQPPDSVFVVHGHDEEALHYGASRLQYEAEGVGDRALQFRARQNVVLELGFFYGDLGWENVFVLLKKSGKVFPNFERPSDLEGAVFDPIDQAGKWKLTLTQKLQAAGFHLRASK